MSTLTPLLDRPAAPPAPPTHRPDHQALPGIWRRHPQPPPLRQLIASLVMLPLTLLPFVAYAMLTPEGRLLRDRAMVALAPPHLVSLSPQQRAAAVAAAPRYDGPVMALAYHGIGSASDGEGGFIVSARRFSEHLATLKAAGMRTVTATQVADALAGKSQLPPNAVMISFDDGRADAMMFADPLLREAGMSATMFVIAGAASEPGIYYASWDRIEAYARSGRWDIQSHTSAAHREQKVAGDRSLPALTSLAPGESLEDYRMRIRRDLAQASADIEQHVGRRPVAFAYPFGAYGADRTNDPAIAAVLREEVARHYDIGFQQDEQETVPLVTSAQDPLRLRRVEVENWSGIELLRRIERARQALAGTDAGNRVFDPVPLQAPEESPLDERDLSTATPVRAGTAGGGGRTVQGPDSLVPPQQAGTGSSASPTAPPSSVSPPTAAPTVTRPSGTSPSTTAPPATSPPTTAPTRPPPTTSPPTTVCREAGNSNRCPPGRS